MYPGKIVNNRINKNVGPSAGDKAKVNQKSPENSMDFNELLATKLSSVQTLEKIDSAKSSSAQRKLTFSAHASKRLSDRNIKFSDQDRQELENLVEKVREKGGKDALVMMKRAGFLVSVKNSKVITVLDSQQLKSNVITNIDAAVIA